MTLLLAALAAIVTAAVAVLTGVALRRLSATDPYGADGQDPEVTDPDAQLAESVARHPASRPAPGLSRGQVPGGAFVPGQRRHRRLP
ncbi:hypothetical protein AB0912_15355 [Streptomyces sp. NPDC007084]|uniref:hypothetical protein n=1 Tax=Streptomyces sp. NPDC007084 TaxID=3154313 RepID=UPI003453D6E4